MSASDPKRTSNVRHLLSFYIANNALVLNVCDQFIRAGQKPTEQG